jgi:hypothetical protein
MLFNNTTYIGIDPTAGQKPFCYAALDNELRLLALGEGRLDEILAFAGGQRQSVVAVCAPRKPNQGVMQRKEIRQNLNPIPAAGRWVDFRLSDYLLRQRNISVPQTPARPENCPQWMQMGFQLFDRLASIGYRPYPAGESALQDVEVYPHACYTALIGSIPLGKYTLEGRLQRQLILFEQKLKIPDPMLFFEEITRRRLINGVLPTDHLYSTGELDALVAAYTAWQAVNHPEMITILGDITEGQVILPVADLKSHY